MVQVPVTAPSLLTIVIAEEAVQLSVAEAEPSAALIAAVVGLQPRALVVPVAVRVGATRSSVHEMVRDVEAVLPQASVAVHDLV